MFLQQGQKQSQTPTKKGSVNFTMVLSDELQHLYKPENKNLHPQVLAYHLKWIKIYEKELDEALPWYKTVVATIASMKTKHVFAIFRLKEFDMMCSVDFYIDNRVEIRLGSHQTIIEGQQNQNRKNCTQVKNESGGLAELDFQNQKNVSMYRMMEILYQITPADGYSQFSYNCSHFCKDLQKKLREEENRKEEKTPKVKVGFSLR